jgi:hypothetical protein
MGLYTAPDIRLQTLEDAEAFIGRKRVDRLSIAHTYAEQMQQKALKVHDRDTAAFAKQQGLFENDMERCVALLTKLQNRLDKLRELHGTLTNVEAVLNKEA